MRIAYQGAPGAYSEECAALLFPDAEFLGQHSFAAVFDDLRHRRADAAVLPVENSTAGAVADVYDLLLRHEDVAVVGEAIIPIRHCLLGLPGAKLSDVTVARSHPQALAQSEDFLRANRIEPRESYDTAGAAREVAQAGDPSIGAVASRRAGDWAGLVPLAEDIQTVAGNSTRFFVLARPGETPHSAIPAQHRAGDPKTSLVFATADRPGALVQALQPFATAGVDLAKIESRPNRDAPWTYVFYVDVRGDVAVSPAREALALLRTCCSWVRVLGTYPAATT